MTTSAFCLSTISRLRYKGLWPKQITAVTLNCGGSDESLGQSKWLAYPKQGGIENSEMSRGRLPKVNLGCRG